MASKKNGSNGNEGKVTDIPQDVFARMRKAVELVQSGRNKMHMGWLDWLEAGRIWNEVQAGLTPGQWMYLLASVQGISARQINNYQRFDKHRQFVEVVLNKDPTVTQQQMLNKIIGEETRQGKPPKKARGRAAVAAKRKAQKEARVREELTTDILAKQKKSIWEARDEDIERLVHQNHMAGDVEDAKIFLIKVLEELPQMVK